MWLLVLVCLVFSCDVPKGQKKADPSVEPSKVKELFKARGCTDCHDRRIALVGPAFVEIAKRYRGREEAESMLIKSIREGSCSRWKARWECMPPQRIEETEARAMVRWILNLTLE